MPYGSPRKTTNQSLGHERTHVLTAQAIGEPTEALLGEGIAVCLDHSGRDHHAEAARLLVQGKLLPLTQMLGDSWLKQEAAVAYTESGSFVCLLLETCGVERFQKLYGSQNLQADLKQGCELRLPQREQAWLAQLKTR